MRSNHTCRHWRILTSKLCFVVCQESLLELEPCHLRLAWEITVKEGVLCGVDSLFEGGALAAQFGIYTSTTPGGCPMATRHLGHRHSLQCGLLEGCEGRGGEGRGEVVKGEGRRGEGRGGEGRGEVVKGEGRRVRGEGVRRQGVSVGRLTSVAGLLSCSCTSCTNWRALSFLSASFWNTDQYRVSRVSFLQTGREGGREGGGRI